MNEIWLLWSNLVGFFLIMCTFASLKPEKDNLLPSYWTPLPSNDGQNQEKHYVCLRSKYRQCTQISKYLYIFLLDLCFPLRNVVWIRQLVTFLGIHFLIKSMHESETVMMEIWEKQNAFELFPGLMHIFDGDPFFLGSSASVLWFFCITFYILFQSKQHLPIVPLFLFFVSIKDICVFSEDS